MTKEDLQVMRDVQFFPNDLVLFDNNTITTVEYVTMYSINDVRYKLVGYITEVPLERLERIV